MHNYFILQQYVCYTTILNIFRAAPCSYSGGQIVLLQPLVSSLSANSRTVCRLRADSALNLHTVRPFTEGDDTRGCGATICPLEDEVGKFKKSILWCTVRKTSNYDLKFYFPSYSTHASGLPLVKLLPHAIISILTKFHISRFFIFVLPVFSLLLSFLISWLFVMSPLLSFSIRFACISPRVTRNKTKLCACLIEEGEPISSVSIVTRIRRGLPHTLS